jgi:hypothetical protein
LEQENPALKVITPRQQGVDKRLKKLASSSNAVNVFSRRSSYHRSKKKKKKKIRIQPLNFLQKTNNGTVMISFLITSKHAGKDLT